MTATRFIAPSELVSHGFGGIHPEIPKNDHDKALENALLHFRNWCRVDSAEFPGNYLKVTTTTHWKMLETTDNGAEVSQVDFLSATRAVC
jgi:hypothetical protein